VTALAETHAGRSKGIILVVAAAIAWSTAPFFTRILHFDSWTILFWRGLFGAIAIVALMTIIQGRDSLKDLATMGQNGWLVASLSAFGMVCFIPALQLTSVANVAIIIATGPFITAALAWLWIGEVPRLRTIVASAVALCGIAIIVGRPSVNADLLGIALAVLMTIAIAAMTVVIRRHRDTPMVAAAALSNILGSTVSIPFAGGIAAVTQADLATFVVFGFCQVALGLTFFVLGSRHLPSGQAALIATLETPLMPFWIWVAFGELPTLRAFVGGALVMGAVIADIVGDLRAQPRL
jgi:drug/metabolite transporter (DMT)-like permease